MRTTKYFQNKEKELAKHKKEEIEIIRTTTDYNNDDKNKDKNNN